MFRFCVLLVLGVQLVCANEGKWSKTGHRVIGEVAQQYLKGKTKRAIAELLDGQDLAFVSNYADEIKADRAYKEFYAWHYVNLRKGERYEDTDKNPQGDLMKGIEYCVQVLKDENASKKDKAFYLKMLVHFIGDLHQPMHVGRPDDKGGNTIQLQWHGRGSNLHKVWDTNMIDGVGLSYTEWTDTYPKLKKKEREKLQAGTIYDWMYESRDLADTIYDSVNVGEKIGYRYSYDFLPIVRDQLHKGGLRLAKLLNDIF
ncbi:S1/P1 nuclease [Sediminicola luteus]|uniref:S1/P1 Nuclease n=1 Tax=Sediminicola luteus TaxID=319238 RepID=A0A2A4G4E8_9FLAO|nr:S1/P1 nuclease [Sediminicola luteus]PCE63537.1 S1/P1 Nuclease [Sediminicola luteus]